MSYTIKSLIDEILLIKQKRVSEHSLSLNERKVAEKERNRQHKAVMKAEMKNSNYDPYSCNNGIDFADDIIVKDVTSDRFHRNNTVYGTREFYGEIPVEVIVYVNGLNLLRKYNCMNAIKNVHPGEVLHIEGKCVYEQYAYDDYYIQIIVPDTFDLSLTILNNNKSE